MPIIKSAKKRVRVARRATARNVKTKRTLKTAVKNLHAAITGKKDAASANSRAQSAIDTAVKKGIMHKNKAARKKAQLARAAKAAGVKPVAKKTTAKKVAPAKKATPKKAVAKKAVTKKPAAKKK